LFKRGVDLKWLLNEVKEKGRIDSRVRALLRENYGSRLDRALECLEWGRVKKYVFKPSGRVLWLVVGEGRQYIIRNMSFCTCEDFYLEVLVRREINACYHIIARVLGEALGKYEEYEESDASYSSIVMEALP